jgi:uncharacterized protein YecE (DUF72 family)
VSLALVGTSGWSYPSWRPGFYPAATAPDAFLEFYAATLPAVELNTTAYRLPAEEQFRRWAERVPQGFRFAVKAPSWGAQRIGFVEERVRALGDSLGCIRVVLVNRRDEGLVELLLGSIDPTVRWALDLRHPSWDGIEPRLAEAGVVRVGDWDAAAGWRYLRFREPPYQERDLHAIAARMTPLLEDGVEVFAFFRHEDEPEAPRAAARLLELLAAG